RDLSPQERGEVLSGASNRSRDWATNTSPRVRGEVGTAEVPGEGAFIPFSSHFASHQPGRGNLDALEGHSQLLGVGRELQCGCPVDATTQAQVFEVLVEVHHAFV